MDLDGEVYSVKLSQFLSNREGVLIEDYLTEIYHYAEQCETLAIEIKRIEKLGDADNIVYARKLKVYLDKHIKILEKIYNLYKQSQ